MSELKCILARINRSSLDAGGSISIRAIKELRRHRKTQFTIFLALEVLLLSGIIYCVYFSSHHPADRVLVKTITGIVGIGAGGGLEVMRRVWKEWSRTDLLLVLMSEASEAQVKALIDKLLKNM